MKIGNNLSQIRNAQKLSEEFVAEKLKLKVEDYIKIENDEIDITLSLFEAIAEILSTIPVDIIQYNDPSSTGIKNYFYNHNGNAGININVQGIDQEQIRKGYKELYIDELSRVPKLERLLRENGIDFDY